MSTGRPWSAGPNAPEDATMRVEGEVVGLERGEAVVERLSSRIAPRMERSASMLAGSPRSRLMSLRVEAIGNSIRLGEWRGAWQ